MEFRILGPLEVVEDGRPLALGRLKERIVLGVLLLHANEFVSRERLIDDLWGVAPPDTARKAVNVYVSKLRKTLSRNDHDPIATEDGGYRLVVEADRIDAARVRSLVGEARERVSGGDPDAASRLLQEALALWRGPTLAGLTLESFGRDEVAALDELRLGALMDRIDCDLALGEHERVLGELQLLVSEHPLRERFRAQQMLALYRADRQADALEAYQQARHDLRDELGIEPSESLQRLQQAILRHDPALEAPTGIAGANGTVPSPVPGPATAAPPRRSLPRRPAIRRRYLVAVGLAAAAAVAALAAFLFNRGNGVAPPRGPVSYVGSDSSEVIDPATGKFVPGPNGGNKPGPMVVVGHRLWILIRGSGGIGVYDLRARKQSPPIPAGTAPYDIVADANGAWVSQRKPVVTWIHAPANYEVNHPYTTPPVTTQNIPVHMRGAGAEAFGGGYVWVIPGPLGAGNRVALIDARHGRFAGTIPLGPGLETSAIAYGYGAAWVATWDPQHSTAWLTKVTRGSVPTARELETGDGAGPLAVAVGNGSVWTVTSRGNLLRIDPGTFQVTHRIPMASKQPALLAVGSGFIWTANNHDYSVSQIDPGRNKIVRTIPLGSYSAVPCGLTATHDGIFAMFGESTCT